ncbi:MAG: hypothetical protein R2729_24400 [Bryobacteraceae bacterium]
MSSLFAALGSNPYLFLIEQKIRERSYGPADAWALIKYSDLTRLQTNAHPGPHVLSTAPFREEDFHLEGTSYANRTVHSMFRSEQAASETIASALNTEAGAEAIRRLRMLSLGRRAVLYSRTAAGSGPGVLRTANPRGVWMLEGPVDFVTLVLDHHGDGQLVLQTAYPNLTFAGSQTLTPPAGADMLEMPRNTVSMFWGARPN